MNLKWMWIYSYSFIIIFNQFNVVRAQAWGYEGQSNVILPSNWDIVNKNCNGLRQSPIDISQNFVDYTSRPSRIAKINGLWNVPISVMAKNNGHSVELTFNYHTEREIPTIIANTGIYKFAQVHVHFGKTSKKGSEHSFDQHFTAAEVHAVFQNIKSTSINSTESFLVMTLMTSICGDRPKRSAAPWTNIYKTNNCKLVDFNKWFAMKHWWPYEEGNKYKVSPIARFTLADFVIAQPSFEYFTYLGSLTTPPCTEDTRFIIPNICSCITKKTIKIMRRTTTTHGYMAGNYRPTKSKGLVKDFPHIEFMTL